MHEDKRMAYLSNRTTLLVVGVMGLFMLLLGLLTYQEGNWFVGTAKDREIALPLNEMGEATYYGFQGGLYPNGQNDMPPEHAAEGVVRAGLIRPLNGDGVPAADGKYILLSIGISNTAMEFCSANPTGFDCKPGSFMQRAKQDADVNDWNLVIINGAKVGQGTAVWDTPDEANYDRIRDDILRPNALSEAQVQIIWLKVTNKNVGGNPTLPAADADAYLMLERMGNIVRSLKVRYPNLQQVYVSSRIYAGYATGDLSPEPYAYESGYAVKWLIEAQINQMVSGDIDPIAGDLNFRSVAPWISWGPYLWADGETPRQDGLTWPPGDFRQDGVHPNRYAIAKVGAMLLDYFKSSEHSQCWFLQEHSCQEP